MPEGTFTQKNYRKCFPGALSTHKHTSLSTRTLARNGKYEYEVSYRTIGRHLETRNDPKHKSRLAKAFLQEKFPIVLEWPSNSPDLRNLNYFERFMME
ncbi:28552_t:CDS:2, partial [Dentiscutata erythropus]